MSLPPDDENPLHGQPEIDEPTVGPHDTRPLKPLWPRPAAGASPTDVPAATILRQSRPDPTRDSHDEIEPGIDESTDRLRLIPKLPNPPVWRVIFLVGHPATSTLGLDVRQALVVGRGEGSGEQSIGLDLSAHGALQQGVSRQHAVLIPTVEGLLVSDLGSTNGTWVNGQYIQPGDRHCLAGGDRIELGLLRLVVRTVTLISRSTD